METAVTSCTFLKNWKAKDGSEVPIYLVGTSDMKTGESFKTQIPIGTPVSELVFEAGQYGIKVKWNKPQTSGFVGGFKQQRSGNESFALSYAKDIGVAHIAKGDIPIDSKKILDVAEAFYNWLESKKK